MGENGNKKNTKSTNDRDLAKKWCLLQWFNAKNGVCCNGFKDKTVQKKILLATFGELKYGMYQGCGGLPSIYPAQSQM